MPISKVTINGLEYDAQEFDKDEMDRFNQAWETLTTFYNEYGKPYKFLTDRHKAFLLECLKAMKAHYKGNRFAGCFPREKEFGIRWPQVEDLVGAIDTEWGATTGGTADWTAGQRAWICSAAQNSGTDAAASDIILYNANQEWAFVMFGVRSFNYNPVLKDLIFHIGGNRHSVQQVEEKLRASSMRIAMFDRSYFFDPERSFRIGVTVRSAAPDQIYPIGFVILDGTRAKDLSMSRPSSA